MDLDAKTKNKLYGKGSKALANRSAFPGASGHFFNHNLQDKALTKVRSKMENLHVMVPDNSKSYLDKHLKGEIGGFKVVNVDKKASKYTATLQNVKTNQHHDIHFAFKKFENGEPTKFAHWGDTSHMRDLGYGLPNSGRHLVIQSLTAAKGYGPGYVKTGKKYDYQDNVEKHSFNMRDGLRKKHVPTNDTHLGVPVFVRAPTNEPITDIPKILTNLVGVRPKVGDVKDSAHFHGIAKFAANNLSAPEKRNVAKKFQTLLASKKFHKDPTKDAYQRKLISNHFSTHFGKYMDKENHNIPEAKTMTTIKKLRKND